MYALIETNTQSDRSFRTKVLQADLSVRIPLNLKFFLPIGLKRMAQHLALSFGENMKNQTTWLYAQLKTELTGRAVSR